MTHSAMRPVAILALVPGLAFAQSDKSARRPAIGMTGACFERFRVAHDSSGKPLILTTKELDKMAVERKMPTFPPMGARITGSVRMRVLIDEAGRIRCATGVQGHPILVKWLTDTFGRWRFHPYMSKRKPIPAVGFLDYRFDASDPRLVFLDFNFHPRQPATEGDSETR